MLVVIRGDHRLNEIKLQNTLGAPFRPGRGRGGARASSAPSRASSARSARPVDVLADEALRGLRGLVAGANKPDLHLTGVEPGRDFEPTWVDVRRVEEGDLCPAGSPIRIEPAIEVGNIFKLGHALLRPARGALPRRGRARSSSSGWARTGSDRRASWRPRSSSSRTTTASPGRASVAPFDVELVTLGKPGEEARTLSDRLYDELRDLGLDVLYDDRDASPGEKFADAELLGCPLRVTIGKKSVEAGEIEVQVRRGQEKGSLPLEGAAEAAAELWRTLP